MRLIRTRLHNQLNDMSVYRKLHAACLMSKMNMK